MFLIQLLQYLVLEFSVVCLRFVKKSMAEVSPKLEYFSNFEARGCNEILNIGEYGSSVVIF